MKNNIITLKCEAATMFDQIRDFIEAGLIIWVEEPPAYGIKQLRKSFPLSAALYDLGLSQSIIGQEPE